MGARQKINQAYVNGALCIAGIIGIATESWWVFLGALAVLLALDVMAGSIRLKGRRRQGNGQTR